MPRPNMRSRVTPISLDHELRTRGIRVSVIEPAYTKTQFDANFLEPDSKLDEYRADRAAGTRGPEEVMAKGRTNRAWWPR